MARGNIFRKLISNSLVQLVLAIICAYVFYDDLSHNAIRFFLTISSCLREILVFVLPFLLFSFVGVALAGIPREGIVFVLGLMLTVAISNMFNVCVSGVVGYSLLSDSVRHEVSHAVSNFQPLFELSLPHIAGNGESLLLGVICGFINAFYPIVALQRCVNFIRDCVLVFMKRFFVPCLPLFVGGFLLKLFAEGRMTGFVSNNAKIFAFVCCFLAVYLMIWLFVAAAFKKDRAISIFKNSFPAIVTAFSTMSSAAALPLSLQAAEKNTRDKTLSDAVMPLTVNFHMVGDTIVVPIMAMIVLLAFDKPLPGVIDFLTFGLFFVLNKFAGGGVPSGTIMVTVPILKQYLGFDDTMVAFIIAFYGVMDPIATCGNVAANNFFVVIFQRLRKTLKKTVLSNQA